MVGEREHPALQVAGEVVEPDAAKPKRRLLLTAGLDDDHDRLRVVEQRADPGGIAPVEADVDRPAKMGALEIQVRTAVEQLRPAGDELEQRVERERRQSLGESLVERGALLRVQHRVKREVGRRIGLIGQHDADEILAAHRLERVVDCRWMPIVKTVSLLRCLPQSEPAPCAG